MVSVLPGNRSALDAIGELVGRNISQNLPGAVQQGFQRQIGMNALDRAEQEIAQAGGDPYKIALAFARAGAQNPALERSLGPLMQTAMANAKVGRAFGPESQNLGSFQQNPPIMQGVNASKQIGQIGTQISSRGEFSTPTPFNIMTPEQMDAESKRYAAAVQDPNGYQIRYSQLQNQNNNATSQREALEDMALKSGIKPDELPLFLKSGEKFNPNNPTEWALKTRREYNKNKSDFDKLEKAFIPQLGSGLLGRNREQLLKNLEPSVQDLVKKGFEDEVRTFLANEYLSPTEIGELIHPLTKEKEKNINKLPRGLFPQLKLRREEGFAELPETMSFEEAKERAPNELNKFQNILSDFFIKNVDQDTSLLVLRDYLVNKKDYDWRQIGPAIRIAEEKGLKLDPRQSAEMTDIETQAPHQSLSYIFQDLGRFMKFMRGNK